MENRRNRSGKLIFSCGFFASWAKSLRRKQPHFMKVHQISTTEVPMEGKLVGGGEGAVTVSMSTHPANYRLTWSMASRSGGRSGCRT